MVNTDKMVQWFQNRKGKVTYSMTYRNGPNSYDCSSAVYYAMIEAGILPKGTFIGNTETLYRLEGKLLTPISRSQARKGDIFIAGKKGGSAGAFGHTGVFVSNSQIIHCNGRDNGISQTVAEGRTGSPVYYYRIKGATPPTVDKNVKTVKVGKQATHWANESKGLKIDKSVIGQTYTIMETKTTKQSRSTKVYLIGKNGVATGWLLEQDVDGFKTPGGGNTDKATPSTKPTITGTTTQSESVAGVQMFLNRWFYGGLEVDNLVGGATKKALIKALQMELNKQFKAGLVTDGLWGTKTYNACVTVRPGARGNLSRLIQAALICKGYKVGGFDGIFLDGLEKAVKDFQRKNGLTVDGIVGKATFAALFR